MGVSAYVWSVCPYMPTFGTRFSPNRGLSKPGREIQPLASRLSLFLGVSVRPCSYLFVWLTVWLIIWLTICLSVCLSFPPPCFSLYLSLFVSLYLRLSVRFIASTLFCCYCVLTTPTGASNRQQQQHQQQPGSMWTVTTCQLECEFIVCFCLIQKIIFIEFHVVSVINK